MNLLPANPGMNRFAWDLRYDPPVQIPGAFYVGDPPRGPLVIPGTYQVKLTVKGATQTAPLEVVARSAHSKPGQPGRHAKAA